MLDKVKMQEKNIKIEITRHLPQHFTCGHQTLTRMMGI